MIAQTVGAAFTVMQRHEDLWVEVQGSETVPAFGEPIPFLVMESDWRTELPPVALLAVATVWVEVILNCETALQLWKFELVSNW
jgi:hypothetical protein